MKKLRFLMIGGFLGAGKTTAITRLARHYIDRLQLNVGLVTNDQAYDLVDTHALRGQGFHVGEVPGACFCCQFDDLVATVAQLVAERQPDVIITEPVGSCTDLVATVIEPLRHFHGDQYEIAPLVVLLKPEHGAKILDDQPGTGFSPKAAYIFLKQIEEADVVVVNKVDKLSRQQSGRLVDMVQRRFPGKEVLCASAADGTGFDRLLNALGRDRGPRPTTIHVDYDIYAEGEAELGWLNGTVHVAHAQAQQTFCLDRLLVDLASRLRAALATAGAEPAHLKILGRGDGQVGVVNLVGAAAEVELSRASAVTTAAADLIVNARVAADPDLLADLVKRQLAAWSGDHGLSHELGRIEAFRPGRPRPTHRSPAEPNAG